MSEYNDLPELTTPLGHIPSGDASARLPFTRHLGARSRVRLSYQHDGVQHRGPFHFLTDPEAVLHRIPARQTSTRNTDVNWHALFGDENLLRAWTSTLERVTREQCAMPANSARALPSATALAAAAPGVRRTLDDEDAWAQYAEDAVARLGPTLAHDASGGLILPHLATRAPAPNESRTPIWADKFDADESDFDDEHSAEDLDDVEEPENPNTSSPAALVGVTPKQKQRFRRWVTALAKEVAHRPALDRLAMTRLVLIASLAPVWEDDTGGWFPHLREATASLMGDDDLPTRLRPEASSLAAVCLDRLDQGASPDRRTGTGKAYADLVATFVPHLAQAEVERIASIVQSVYGMSVATVSPQAVLDHLDAMRDTNPWPEIVRLTQSEHPDWSVELSLRLNLWGRWALGVVEEQVGGLGGDVTHLGDQ
ncbi:hypothetical protein [Georgenia yuyongxinii]